MKKANQEGGGNKVLAFFKRNIYFVLIIVCVLAIGTMITVAAINGSKDDKIDDPTVNGDVNDDDDVNGDVDDDKDDEDDDDDKDETKTFSLGKILDEYTVDIGFSNTALVFNPTMQHWATHEGIDMVAAAGSKVYCPFDGTVKSVEEDTFYGTTVVITHDGGYETTYRLLDDVALTKGATVKQGDEIGVISDTALAEIAQGAHLHLELTKDGVRVDPADYMQEGDK